MDPTLLRIIGGVTVVYGIVNLILIAVARRFMGERAPRGARRPGLWKFFAGSIGFGLIVFVASGWF